MGALRKAMLFCAGGLGYVGLELLWRGRSHISMFLAGGVAFLFLGRLRRLPVSVPVRMTVGAAMITAVEYVTGLLVNQDYRVWDYRGLPYNYQGQVCLIYCLLWLPVSLGGMVCYGAIDRHLQKRLPDRQAR